MNSRKRRQRGSAMIEFTLVGIPMIFVLISVFEISRAMWNYHTLAYAIREGMRYAIVHGSGCSADPMNSCGVTIGQVAQRISDAGIGLEPSELNLTFTSSGHAIPCTLNTCLGSTTVWPEAPNNTAGNAVAIGGSLPFQSALALLWPGARGSGMNFPTFYLTAGSADIIQF
jgi:Flp pilus assembly protein TadG